MNWTDYLLWTCMIIQMIIFFLLIRLVTDFLNKFQNQVNIIEFKNSAKTNMEINKEELMKS
ncbi:hypothetical protein PDJ82_09690 [Bacillus cereus group sp. TH43LC]|uniref:hypothetical protein n=1 Tax=Bacillus TaxID=1386 RepID=UPI00094515FA|nr:MULTISPECIES: hypothetical protein [Bacillus cereus group]PNU09243.1 hypothetical protein C2L96_26755 [Bacillus cereus]MBE7144464.1 hypothetical protein [Bacillus paranthracis]MDA1501864.1 hypothetical protein [Bacillus cereus group sp. TH43LC]MDA1788302.1 hypothetical protein [Bacillus cereus group sp. BY5-1LC]MDA1865303.1 hypothetical protein [Bacillus cereus group sp. BY128LC]